MRVLFYLLCADNRIPPNIEILLRTLAREYPEDTYYIMCLEGVHFLTGETSDNMKIIHVKPGLHLEWTRFKMSSGGVARLARERQVDLIWSFNVGLYHQTSVAQIMSMRNAFQIYPRSVALHHPRCGLWVTALRYFFRKSLRNCDGVIVQTDLVKEYLLQIPQSPQRIAVISKAVESDSDVTFQPLPEHMVAQIEGGLGRDTFTFFYAAIHSSHKNHATLAGAMEILRRRNVNARIALTISTNKLCELAGDEARSLVETGHLLTLGRIGKEHLKPLYDISNACVMPSLLESLSSSHLEAMQWGKPQVCADLPYAHDLCGDAALYAAPEDPADWAAKMQQLVDDRTLNDRLVEAGYQRMKRFPKTWGEVAHDTRRFFQEIVDAKAQTTGT